MRIFSALYERMMQWSRHKNAIWFLGGMSFIESIFWPIPVDVMLAPMSLAKPDKAYHYAWVATVTSVSGAAVGYLLGATLYDPVVVPLMELLGAMDKMLIAQSWFEEYGVWVIFIAGFTPIPYKVFTVTAGLLGMAFIPFMLVSVVGRGARFFLVSALMAKGGEPMEEKIKYYVEYIGWAVVAIAVVLYLAVN